MISAYSINGELNLLMDKMNSVADINKTLFFSNSGSSSPERRLFAVEKSVTSKRFLSFQRWIALHNDDFVSEGERRN